MKKVFLISVLIVLLVTVLIGKYRIVVATNCGCPTPTPMVTPTATPTATPTESATPTVTPTATPSGSTEPSVTPTGSSEPSTSPEPTATPTSSSGTGGTGDSGGGNPGAPGCNDTKPLTPYLTGVLGLSGGSVKVNWQKVSDPVTGYSIYYGSSTGNYLYSVVDTGNVDSFTVNGLGSGCFAVRAVNGCATGDLSNEVCTGQGLGGRQVLGASTMGGTGGFTESLMKVIFGIGSFLSGLGFRKASRKSSK